MIILALDWAVRPDDTLLNNLKFSTFNLAVSQVCCYESGRSRKIQIESVSISISQFRNIETAPFQAGQHKILAICVQLKQFHSLTLKCRKGTFVPPYN